MKSCLAEPSSCRLQLLQRLNFFLMLSFKILVDIRRLCRVGHGFLVARGYLDCCICCCRPLCLFGSVVHEACLDRGLRVPDLAEVVLLHIRRDLLLQPLQLLVLQVQLLVLRLDLGKHLKADLPFLLLAQFELLVPKHHPHSFSFLRILSDLLVDSEHLVKVVLSQIELVWRVAFRLDGAEQSRLRV